MTRALGILTAIVALTVSAAPVAVAGPSKKPAPRGTTCGIHEYGHINHYLWVTATRRGGGNVANHTEGTVRVVRDRVTGGLNGIVTNNNDPDSLGALHARDARRSTQAAVIYNGHAGLGANTMA